MLTVLWGLADEGPLRAVHDALQRMGADLRVLDQRRVSDFSVEPGAADATDGELLLGRERVALGEITGWYVRPYDTRRVPAVARAGHGSALWRRAVSLDDSLLGWLEVTDATVVNRPGAMLANGAKPYQLRQIAQAGFDVPDTLVSTDPKAVLAFWRDHGEVIYKSISGVRSTVARLRESDRSRLSDLAHCPTQFQAYIPGTDVRAHVVDDEVFACEIRSDSDDYRDQRAAIPPRITPLRLPRELELRLVAMTRSMGLHVAGVDLRCSPAGKWVCFEVNPSPGFTYYEQLTGQGIAEAIARCLLTPARARPPAEASPPGPAA